MKSLPEQLAEALFYKRLSLNEVEYLYKRNSLICFGHNQEDQRAIKIFKKGEIKFLLIDVVGKDIDPL